MFGVLPYYLDRNPKKVVEVSLDVLTEGVLVVYTFSKHPLSEIKVILTGLGKYELEISNEHHTDKDFEKFEGVLLEAMRNSYRGPSYHSRIRVTELTAPGSVTILIDGQLLPSIVWEDVNGTLCVFDFDGNTACVTPE